MLPNKIIKCLVIEDELLAREILKQHISSVEVLELTGACTRSLNASSAT